MTKPIELAEEYAETNKKRVARVQLFFCFFILCILFYSENGAEACHFEYLADHIIRIGNDH